TRHSTQTSGRRRKTTRRAWLADGWCGGTVWPGRADMRISVSSWAATEAVINGDTPTLERVLRDDPDLVRARSTFVSHHYSPRHRAGSVSNPWPLVRRPRWADRLRQAAAL